jgi:hypothetical protein
MECIEDDVEGENSQNCIKTLVGVIGVSAPHE